MPVSVGTVVQTWSRPVAVLVTLTLLSLHCLAYLVATIVAPSMFHPGLYNGSACRTRFLDFEEVSGSRTGTDVSACVPVGSGEKSPLQESKTSFKFPREEDEVG